MIGYEVNLMKDDTEEQTQGTTKYKYSLRFTLVDNKSFRELTTKLYIRENIGELSLIRIQYAMRG